MSKKSILNKLVKEIIDEEFTDDNNVLTDGIDDLIFILEDTDIRPEELEKELHMAKYSIIQVLGKLQKYTD